MMGSGDSVLELIRVGRTATAGSRRNSTACAAPTAAGTTFWNLDPAFERLLTLGGNPDDRDRPPLTAGPARD